MRTNSWKYLIGGILMMAVFTFAVMAAPADALAKNNGKVPPGQMKKASFTMMNDVYGHWAAEPVTAMQKQGIIAGFPDGKFYPQKEVSKNEALVMLMRALGYEGESPTKSSLRLAPQNWAGDMVALALDNGIITREELEDFDGNDAAQRYEVAIWLARALSDSDALSNVLGGTVHFLDADKIPGYAKNYVAQMARAGIMKGYPGNTFKPQNRVLRAEIAAMLFRCQDTFSLNPKINYIKGTVDEVMPSDPAFISVKTGDDDSLTVLVQVADDAVIFVDGEAAELNDIEDDYAVSMVLNPARKAIVVSARSDGDTDNDDVDEDVDEDAPEIDKLSPEDGAKNVSIGLDTLVATFDERIYPVKSLSDIQDKIEVKNITDDQTIDIWDIDIDGREFIIELKEGLDEDCRYSVYIPANIIKDDEGNKFSGIDSKDWRFVTLEDEDEDAPEIYELSPEDDEEVEFGLKIISVKFDEKVQWSDEKSSSNTVIIFNKTTNSVVKTADIDIEEDELIIKFSKKLPVGEYSVSISSGIIEDLSGNEFAGLGVNDWVFEVIDEDD